MPNTSSEPDLDGADIQGNILPGFIRAQRLLLFLQAESVDAFCKALRLIGPVTTLTETLPHRLARKMAFLAGVAPTSPAGDPIWTNVAAGRQALQSLGLNDIVALDPAFRDGMWSKKGAGLVSRVGDPTAPKFPDGKDDPACPANWKRGGSRRIDLLVILASDANLMARAMPLIDRLKALPGIEIDMDFGEKLPGEKEHFGFMDGISEPGLYGQVQIDGVLSLVTSRYGVPSRDGIDFGRPGQPLCWPGQFLLGNSTGPGGAVTAGIPTEARNGSFLVFRRLNQDVASFLVDTDAIARDLSQKLADPSLTGDMFRAKVVGRWPSGEPIMRSPSAPPADQEIDLALNYFLFGVDSPPLRLSDGTQIAGVSGDPAVIAGGRVCPSWAHIRKVNSRDLGTDKPQPTRMMQMLRRGIPFGPAFNRQMPNDPVNTEERGLLFLAYQASIVNGFEVLNNDWMNQAIAPPPGSGFDVLVGQNSAGGHYQGKSFSTLRPDGALEAQTAPRQWVYPTGGAYLFAPSVSLAAEWAAHGA